MLMVGNMGILSNMSILWGWVEKLTYREIDQVRSALKGSVAGRRDDDELSIRQASVYFDRFFDRREVVIASHDENRCRDLFEVGGFHHDGDYPHAIALLQHRHPMTGTVGAYPSVVDSEVGRHRVADCLKFAR